MRKCFFWQKVRRQPANPLHEVPDHIVATTFLDLALAQFDAMTLRKDKLGGQIQPFRKVFNGLMVEQAAAIRYADGAAIFHLDESSFFCYLHGR